MRIVCRRQGDAWIQLEVADQGVGISAEDLPRIFDEFVQLSNSSAEGTGLGLPISKRLAELLGGELNVTSTPGAGRVFRLRLPALQSALSGPFGGIPE